MYVVIFHDNITDTECDAKFDSFKTACNFANLEVRANESAYVENEDEEIVYEVHGRNYV